MGLASSKPKISSKDKAILELKVQRDKLKQYEKKILVVIEKELEIAKQQVLKKNHHAARLALHKKKYQESLLEKTSNQLMNIEQLVNTIEYALVEQEVIQKLQQGNQVLNLIHKEMDLEKVQKIMDDTADGIAYQREIEETIMAGVSEQDEGEIMAELDKLVEQEEREKIIDLPSVPKSDQVDESRIEDVENLKVPKKYPKEKSSTLQDLTVGSKEERVEQLAT